MKTRQIGILLVAVFAGGAVAGAYKLNGPKWGVQQVPYYINPVNSSMSEANAIAAIQAGAAAWSMQSSATIMPYYMGQTSGNTLTKNGKNEVFFRNASSGSLYGETLWWYDGSYRLVEADIVYYSTYPFFAGNSGCSNGIYLEDAAAHEFGHALGLGHSSLSSATMYPTMSKCSTSARVLDPDDLAGIEALYPPTSANTPPSVTVSSPSAGTTVDQGTTIGFSGAAMDSEDGNISGGLVWLSSRDGQIGTGPSFQRVLTVGTHTITARITDSNGATTQTQRSLVVEAPVTATTDGFWVQGRAYKVKGVQKVDLSWGGSTAGSVDVYRNGSRIAITANDGAHTDAINKKGGGAYTYVVCNAATTTCSNTIKVTF
jgi:hypothetical protein